MTLQMSGMRSPQTKLGAEGKPDPKLCEPFAVEAHYFTESRLLQRDVEVIYKITCRTCPTRLLPR